VLRNLAVEDKLQRRIVCEALCHRNAEGEM